MSQKFKDRVLTGSGVSNKRFTSDYGSKLLMQMGWTEGKGLGKDESGIQDCIQIQRRSENQGLGKEDNKNFKWNDCWWENSFNDALKAIQCDEESSTSSSEDDEQESQLRVKKLIKKQK